MPIRLAIAAAVILWSPVIITGRIPASMQDCTAAFDSSLGGSIIAVIPRNTRFSSSFSSKSEFESNIRYPNASTRKPFSAYVWFCCSIFLLSDSEILYSIPSRAIFFISGSILSTAPFTIITRSAPVSWTVVIILRVLSNGLSPILGFCLLTVSASMPAFAAILIKEVSVGSPISFSSVQTASLHNTLYIINFWNSGSCLVFSYSNDISFPSA